MWIFDDIWVMCVKPPFLHSLDVPIKMFTNSLAVLNQKTLRWTSRVLCFQRQLTESCLVVWFWPEKDPSVVSFSIKKQS